MAFDPTVTTAWSRTSTAVHVVPMYRVIRRSETLLCNASLAACGHFVAAYLVVTIVMTVPQVLAVWTGPSASGVSLVSWAAYLVSACLWFVYGLQKRDKTIYVACIGWIALDAVIVAGVIVRG